MTEEKAERALLAIPTPADRESWLSLTMAYKAEGGSFEVWDEWSKKGEGYNERANRQTWQSIKAEGGISGGTLYKMALSYGWTDTDREKHRQNAKKTHLEPRRAKLTPPPDTHKVKSLLSMAALKNANIRQYCKGRGLTDETIERFNLGYDPNTHRLIIPYPGADYYAARAINEDTQPRYLFPTKEQAGEKPVFNILALTGGAETVFITEGQIDAISIEQSGGAAIASNTSANVIDAIRHAGAEITAKRFLIVPDNDKDADGHPDRSKGEKIARKMLEDLTAAGITAYIYPLPDSNYKDVNEMLQTAAADVWEWVREKDHYIAQQERRRVEQYKQITGAARLAELDRLINENATREAIPTGYKTLDVMLGDKGYTGGLYPGLYIIGAISSLGKTTFTLQMADQIAEQGQDVLIFSLEMSAAELIAKSISRLTYHTAARNQDRKTTRGILSGKRYQYYTAEEITAINNAKARYKELAERVYITEGTGNIGVLDVINAVKTHKEITGRAPVVIIDYLQIIAPEDTKATERQNTDRAIVALKRLSRDYNIPVVAISSFNRENYTAAVTESAFKESGAIEYSSDVLIGLQFTGAGDKGFDVRAAKAEIPRSVELVILKNRNGAIPPKPVVFNFYPLFNYFEDVNNGSVINPAILETIFLTTQAERKTQRTQRL